MNSNADDEYLEKIEEFVYDEDKIVTYTWLSTNLGINVSKATELLKKYVQKVRQTKPDDLSIIYIILGIKDGKSLAVTVSKECDLEKNMLAYDNVTLQQIYSVQKLKDMDVSVLSLVDALSAHNLREKPMLGSVVGKNCVKRNLKMKRAVGESSSVKIIKQEKKLIVEKKVQSDGQIESASNKSNQKKQNGIANFFNKSQSAGDCAEKNTKNKNTKNKSNGTMSKFLASKPEPQKENVKLEVTAVADKQEDEVKEIKSVEDDTKPMVNENMFEKTESKKKKSSKRPRKSNNKSEQLQKKRKRIIERHDSDSDDIFGSDDENLEFETANGSRKRSLSSADEVGNTTDEDCSSIYQLPKPVNKKRKQVTRTFKDEDGYIITRKEFILEEESVGEEKENLEKNETSSVEIAEESNTLKNQQKENSKKQEDLKNVELKKSSSEELPSKTSLKKKGKGEIPKNQQTLFNFFKKT